MEQLTNNINPKQQQPTTLKVGQKLDFKIYSTSQNGINLIKRFEGCKLTSYKCPANVWTIGYGHTLNVKPNQKITQQQAEQFLKQDLVKFENCINNIHIKKLNQNKFDALVSFTFNVGIGAFQSSTLRKKVVNDSDDKNILLEFYKWIYANGKQLAGLKQRRKAEADLYFKK